MLNNERVTEILTKTGVLKRGHFELTSGRHADTYMQCAQILQYPVYSDELCKALADEFADDKIDVVIGPATGGIIISYEIARHLNARNLFAERENGKMALRRGFQINNGERVLVAEDVVTTGGSVMEVIDLVKSMGGELAGVAVLVDRSNGTTDFGAKLRAAYSADIVSYEPDDCPLCKEGIPLASKQGSRNLK